MRILFITAFYPPHIIGGWEQLVQDIDERLQARGHTSHVLTSTYRLQSGAEVNGAEVNGRVDRLLTLESDLHHYKPLQLIQHKQRLNHNLTYTSDVIRRFQPDVVFIHVMWNLSPGIAWLAEQLCPGRVVYYVASDWPYAPNTHMAYWRDPARNPVLNLAKRLVAPIPLKMIEDERKQYQLQFEHVLCVSEAIRSSLIAHTTIQPHQARVIYNGVETDLFQPPPDHGIRQREQPGLSLLYAGGLVQHKGVHTAIEAMAILARESKLNGTTLSLVGAGHPAYEARLRELSSGNGLDEHVRFLGRVPREEMPALLRKYDILVFPSTGEEGLARVMQEAMAAGLTVVGTRTGGSSELLLHEETGLAFEPGNAAEMAECLCCVLDDRDLLLRLADNGRQKVLKEFDLERMIDEIESYFEALLKREKTV